MWLKVHVDGLMIHHIMGWMKIHIQTGLKETLLLKESCDLYK